MSTPIVLDLVFALCGLLFFAGSTAYLLFIERQ